MGWAEFWLKFKIKGDGILIILPMNKTVFLVAMVLSLIVGVWGFYSYYSYEDAQMSSLVEVVGVVEHFGHLDSSSIDIIIKNNSDKYLINSYITPVLDIENFADYISRNNMVYMLAEAKGQKYKSVYEIKDDKGNTFLDFQDVVLAERENSKLGLYIGIIFILIGTVGIIVFFLFVRRGPKTLLSKEALEYMMSIWRFERDNNKLYGDYKGYNILYIDNIDYFSGNNYFSFSVVVSEEIDKNTMKTLEENFLKNGGMYGSAQCYPENDGRYIFQLAYKLLGNSKQLKMPSVSWKLSGILKKEVILDLMDNMVNELEAKGIKSPVE